MGVNCLWKISCWEHLNIRCWITLCYWMTAVYCTWNLCFYLFMCIYGVLVSNVYQCHMCGIDKTPARRATVFYFPQYNFLFFIIWVIKMFIHITEFWEELFPGRFIIWLTLIVSDWLNCLKRSTCNIVVRYKLHLFSVFYWLLQRCLAVSE